MKWNEWISQRFPGWSFHDFSILQNLRSTESHFLHCDWTESSQHVELKRAWIINFALCFPSLFSLLCKSKILLQAWKTFLALSCVVHLIRPNARYSWYADQYLSFLSTFKPLKINDPDQSFEANIFYYVEEKWMELVHERIFFVRQLGALAWNGPLNAGSGWPFFLGPFYCGREPFMMLIADFMARDSVWC